MSEGMPTYKLNVKMPDEPSVQPKTIEFYVTAAHALERVQAVEGVPALSMLVFEKTAQFELESYPRTRDYGRYRSRTPLAAQRFVDEIRLQEGEAPLDAPRFGVGFVRVDSVPKNTVRVAYADTMYHFIKARCDYLPTFDALRKSDKLSFWTEMLLTGDELLQDPKELADAEPGATDSGIARNVVRRMLQHEIVSYFPVSDLRLMERQLVTSKGNASLLEMCYGADTLFVPTPKK